MKLIVMAACALLMAARSAAHAQLSGVVKEEGGTPLPAVFVALYDSVGRRAAGTLTDSAGAYRLPPALSGTFTLRAEQIGFRTSTAGLQLISGESRRHDIVLSNQPIALAEISVHKDRRCAVRAQDGREIARLWSEARKALTVTEWADAQRDLRYDLIRFKRDLDPNTLRITKDSLADHVLRTSRVFESVPSSRLRQHGYVQKTDSGTFLYAPDATTLLSDEFVDTHCFRLEQRRMRDGLIGLTFSPTRDRKVPEVQGTVWLRHATAALVEMEYTYVNTPRGMATEGAGGKLEFEALPSGAWIIRRWYVRSPVVALRSSAFRGSSVREPYIIALREDGGEVVRITTRSGKEVRTASLQEITGVVFDSIRAVPVPNAVVYLSGTVYTSATDAQGRFRIVKVPAGKYTLAVGGSRLDSLPRAARPSTEVTVSATAPATVALAIPTLSNALRAACAAWQPGSTAPVATSPGDTAAVSGRVVRGPARVALPGARVLITWNDFGVSGETRSSITRVQSGVELFADADGWYSACGLPIDALLTARVLEGETVVGELSFRSRAEGVLAPDLVARSVVKVERRRE